MKRKICVITGTRAEYGLLRWVMQGIKDDPSLILQVIATGAHLSPKFGLTYRDIKADGFKIDRKIEILTKLDNSVGITKSMGLAMIGFGEALEEMRPDLIVVLGDRYEIFSAVAAALVARIPVAHLSGGEVTEGAFDEAFRHSITKMSHLHFVAAEDYQHRVVQLGEDPNRVFLVGGLGVDAIKRVTLLDKEALEESLGIKLGKRSLLITFHPVTLEDSTASTQMKELLASLSELEDTQLIFTLPNADTGGLELIGMVEQFVKKNGNALAFASLGQQRYLSCLALVDGVVGNSSSGLAEVPSFNKGTINIGDRQKGRLKSISVIDCEPIQKSIKAALEKLYSPEFQLNLTKACNPYGDGGASEKIVTIIKNATINEIIKKSFHDLPNR